MTDYDRDRFSAHFIEEFCNQAIATGCLAFVAIADVGAVDIGFEQPTGRICLLDRNRTRNILEIADTTRPSN